MLGNGSSLDSYIMHAFIQRSYHYFLLLFICLVSLVTHLLLFIILGKGKSITEG